MPLRTDIRLEASVLVVQYDGAVSFAARAQALDEVMRVLREQRVRRLLIDFTGAWPVREDAAAAEAFASKLAATEFPEDTAVAYLNPPRDHGASADEAAAEARFFLRRFFNRRHALEWLQGGE